MITKITSISIINTSVGDRVAYTYTTLDHEGKIYKENVKGDFVAFNKEVLDHVVAIKEYVKENKINKELNKTEEDK
ncbi:hypothetical protein ACOAKC_02565 [Hathewaya histolytica]|uniref:hypothetical protein n=1 Tax=Hathewaya histolytica TaxID=1498 RepID=UPI003B681AF4